MAGRAAHVAETKVRPIGVKFAPAVVVRVLSILAMNAVISRVAAVGRVITRHDASTNQRIDVAVGGVVVSAETTSPPATEGTAATGPLARDPPSDPHVMTAAHADPVRSVTHVTNKVSSAQSARTRGPSTVHDGRAATSVNDSRNVVRTMELRHPVGHPGLMARGGLDRPPVQNAHRSHNCRSPSPDRSSIVIPPTSYVHSRAKRERVSHDISWPRFC